MSDIDKIGGVVASEIHGMCSWDGETSRYWAKFDVDPSTVAISRLRKHLIGAVPYEGEKPDGHIWITAFNA